MPMETGEFNGQLLTSKMLESHPSQTNVSPGWKKSSVLKTYWEKDMFSNNACKNHSKSAMFAMATEFWEFPPLRLVPKYGERWTFASTWLLVV